MIDLHQIIRAIKTIVQLEATEIAIDVLQVMSNVDCAAVEIEKPLAVQMLSAY